MQKLSESVELSIIMAACNSAKTIKQAVDSLLLQSFGNFELIIINDGSTDETENIICSFNDSRIKYLKNESRAGAAAARNRGLKAAKGNYIGIFDSDDIAHPRKFELQLNFIKKHTEIGVVGCSANLIDENGEKIGKYQVKALDEEIRANMLFHNYFIHSALVFRKELLNDEILYDESLQIVEDYRFLLELLTKTKAVNLRERLVSYRIHSRNTMSSLRHLLNQYDRIIATYILLYIGIDADEEEIRMHLSLKNRDGIQDLDELKRIKLWLTKVGRNAIKHEYSKPEAIKKIIINRWLKVCYKLRKQPLLLLYAIIHIPLLISQKNYGK
jgi:glycosyltransferase involved in cell wall biosynthesis